MHCRQPNKWSIHNEACGGKKLIAEVTGNLKTDMLIPAEKEDVASDLSVAQPW